MESYRVQAVTFDVGGTLIQPWPSVGEIYVEVAEQCGIGNLDAQLVERQFCRAWAEKEDFQHNQQDWLELLVQSFRNVLTRSQCIELFPAVFARFARADAWRIHDDVLPALDELSGRGFRLAVVSNWDIRLRSLLKDLKLMSFFETVSISGEVGFPKPSPVLFEHVLKKLGLPGDAVVHVGDSVQEDVSAARNSGLAGILIRRSVPSGNGTISRLGELSGLLQEAW